MIKMSCPYCEAVHDVEEIKRNESIEYKGKTVSYEAVLFCFPGALLRLKYIFCTRKGKSRILNVTNQEK